MNRVGFLTSCAAFCVLPAVARATGAATADAVERIIDDYAKRALNAGAPPAMKVPKVVLRTTRMIASYFGPDNVVMLASYDDMPPPVQTLFDRWATAADNGWNGAKLVDETFHWFIIPHEMTHWVQTRGGTQAIDGDRRHQTESEANRVAVAYHRLTPGGPERLASFTQAMTKIRASLPNPVPAGADQVAYFNENYGQLAGNPVAYGWYQLGMMIDAATQSKPATFDDQIKAIVARG